MTKNNIKDYLFIMMPIILLFVVMIGVIIFSSIIENSKWNDGHCSCGGNWVYEQAVGHQFTTGYMYMCDECGKRYEFGAIK